jgi:hypothetical protein
MWLGGRRQAALLGRGLPASDLTRKLASEALDVLRTPD